MDEMNVCRFVPLSDSAEWIHIINFIYETKYRDASLNKLDTSYKMAYVSEGSCTLSCRGVRQAARKGDSQAAVLSPVKKLDYTSIGV